ncbi:hypothetical protein RhiJN_07821 [Ceratobasidium sp. AG-Ba]|nr:hypothetical protein RhiJN_07821 [Ceratobasidium sp. AG-Ba]
MPMVQYGTERRYMLVPPDPNHQTGKESDKDKEYRKGAEEFGVKDLKWEYLPMTYIHYW